MKRSFLALPAVVAIALGTLAFAPSAQAANCGVGTVSTGWGPFYQERGFGSCGFWKTASEQARITVDCIAAPDQNTAWFHDYALHYTNWCWFSSRGAFVSVR